MQTSRLLLVIVGDVDPATIQKLSRHRSACCLAAITRPPRSRRSNLQNRRSISRTDSVQTNYVEGSFAAPPIGDPEYYAMRVAISILQTQVYQEVRVKRNLSYAPDAGLNTYAANNAYIYVTAVEANKAVSVMLDAIRDLRQNEVSTDVIRQYGNFFLTTYYLGQESNAPRAPSLHATSLSAAAAQLDPLPRPRPRGHPAQVKAVAEKYMKNIRFTVVGNPSTVDRSIFLQAL